MDIPFVTVEQMTKIDRVMIENLKIPLFLMMDRAGRILSELAIERFSPKKVCVLVGKGNNAGGGIVSALYLHKKRIEVSIVLSSSGLKDAPKKHLKEAKEQNISIKENIPNCDLIIDALLGYNAKGKIKGKVAKLVNEANKKNIPILSLDVPTGFDLETGNFFDVSFSKAIVMTLALPKQFMQENISELWLADIGVLDKVYKIIKFPIPKKLFKKELIRIN